MACPGRNRAAGNPSGSSRPTHCLPPTKRSARFRACGALHSPPLLEIPHEFPVAPGWWRPEDRNDSAQRCGRLERDLVCRRVDLRRGLAGEHTRARGEVDASKLRIRQRAFDAQLEGVFESAWPTPAGERVRRAILEDAVAFGGALEDGIATKGRLRKKLCLSAGEKHQLPFALAHETIEREGFTSLRIVVVRVGFVAVESGQRRGWRHAFDVSLELLELR